MGAGSLIPLKQFDLFIEIVGLLAKDNPSITAVICGKGPEKEKLQQLIVLNGLQENISLLGEVAHEDVLKWMQKSRIFLHTSNYEGFSTVCLEALFAGANVVSAVQPMKKDIEQFHIGKDKEALIEIIQSLLTSDKKLKRIAPYLVADTVETIIKLYH